MDLCLLFIGSVIGVVTSAPLGFDTMLHDRFYSDNFGYEPSVHDVIVSDEFGYEPKIAEEYYPQPVGYYPNIHGGQHLHSMPVAVLHSKGLFSGMTQFIGSMFPIEVNVPDLFTAMWQSIPRPFANFRPFANRRPVDNMQMQSPRIR